MGAGILRTGLRGSALGGDPERGWGPPGSSRHEHPWVLCSLSFSCPHTGEDLVHLCSLTAWSCWLCVRWVQDAEGWDLLHACRGGEQRGAALESAPGLLALLQPWWEQTAASFQLHAETRGNCLQPALVCRSEICYWARFVPWLFSAIPGNSGCPGK